MLSPVKLAGNYLTSNGKSFVPIGVNWVPARSGMQWPYEWDANLVESDFALMKQMGFNLVRFDLLWAWFEPRPGQYNEAAFAQLDFIISLAHRNEIYLIPALLIGGEVGDAYWDIPWRNGRHPHSDPELLYWQTQHVEEFAKRYREETAILAWDLTDEPPFWIVVQSTSEAMAANWTQLLCNGLRKYDPNHLIMCGTLGQETNRGPFRADILAPFVDISCVHPYPVYDPNLYQEPLLSLKTTYGPSFEITLSQGAGHPVMMQEFGAGNAQFSPDVVGKYYNSIIYSTLAAGAQAYTAWCFTDASPELFKRAPYIRCPHETQFGITDYQGNEKPAGRELTHFSETVQKIDFDQITLATPEAGIIVPHEWATGSDYQQYGFSPNATFQYVTTDMLSQVNDQADNLFTVKSWLASYILSRQAGMTVSFPRELDDWSKLALILTPVPSTTSPNPICHLYTTFWQKALPIIENGAVLYASLCGKSALPMPDATDLFGAQLADRAPWQSSVHLTMIEDFFSLKVGDVIEVTCPEGIVGMGMQLEMADGRVLAVDQEGRPALITKSINKGHTVLCAYPLEYSLGNNANAFEKPGNYQRLYRSLKSLAQIQSPFSIDDPRIEIGWLSGRDCDYVFLINHSHQSSTIDVRSRVPGKAHCLSSDTAQAYGIETTSFKVELSGFSGCIYKWIHTN